MTSKIQFIRKQVVDSTSKEILRHSIGVERDGMLVCVADYQEAGRGQKGSSWESEKDKNLLFSLMLWPQNISVKEQFRLSQAMALAICEVLNRLTPGFTIKWPNDIYFGERKVSGTIIETTWKDGFVDRCILGVGINVNQQAFCSDAPNPVSLLQIMGYETDRQMLLEDILKCFSQNLITLANAPSEISRQYFDKLIWHEGLHTYQDAKGRFQARLVDVEPNGCLVLEDFDSKQRRYFFKEVKHIFDTIVCE